MKRILLVLLVALTFTAGAQPYNNEWIDYNKTYYKFKVGSTGLYRINQSALASIGLGNINADHFQLWHNGQEVTLYTSVQNAPLGANGYIDFWGEKNDGKPDNVLYRQPDWQLNDKYSFETDSSAYFITINASGGNARFIPTINNVAGNTLAPEPYYMHTTGEYFREIISSGRAELVGSSYTYSSSYDYGEGWSSVNLATGATRTSVLSGLNIYNGAGAPSSTIRINASGNAVNPRYFRVRLNGDSVFSQTMDYYDYVKTGFNINTSLLSSNTATIEITNRCTNANDRMVIASVEVTYPKRFDFPNQNNAIFTLPPSPVGNYLELSSLVYYGVPTVLYDMTNRKRYDFDFSNPSLLKVLLEPSSKERTLILVSEAIVKEINLFQQRNFTNYNDVLTQGDYLIISHPFLTGVSGSGDPIEDYRAYRSSLAGGSYNAKVYLIDELVDQFAFGIKQHPMSIRNFLRWARANFSMPLKSVLLIGKGITYANLRNFEGYPDIDKLGLVPTFGNPASDNLLSAVGSSSIPLTPIGRLSVINKDEVNVYLDKVKEYELNLKEVSSSIADMDWRKNIIHVTGASDDNTSSILLNALNGHKQIIEDTSYGASVHTFTKATASTIEEVDNSELSRLMNSGIGMLTYFGHSSASSLEFNLENPQNYNNAGKYPVFTLMGCNAGNFYTYNTARLSTKETISERYVLSPERGAIAVMASTHLGIVHYLDIYNSQMYKAMSVTHYGGTLGELMAETIQKVFALTTENDFYARFHCEQFTIHGDPALRLYNYTKPDYVIEEPQVKFSPNFISIAETSFKVDASFMNLGKAVDKKIVVELKRTYPDNTVSTIRDTISGIRFKDSLTYNLPIVASRDKGLNRICITIDADNGVDESFETNNSICKDIYIIEDEARPIYPYNYSIINQQGIKLVASSANAFAENRSYRMELDTTEAFNSSIKISQTVTSAGGVFEFAPSITFTDSTVYYWRVAPIIPTGDYIWNKSSFQYIANAPLGGFSQAHYFQHLKSTENGMIISPDSRKWQYDSTTHFIYAKNAVYPFSGTADGDFSVAPDGEPYIRSACVGNSLIFNIFDPVTFKPVKNLTQLFGSAAVCNSSRQWNFEFSYMTSTSRKNAMDFMDYIPSGYIVVVRNIPASSTNGFVNEWMADTTIHGSGNSLYHKLKTTGFLAVDSFYKQRSLIYMYQKNTPAFVPGWSISNGIYDAITLEKVFETIDTKGSMISPAIGPAKQWGALKWTGSNVETVASADEYSVDIIGVNNAGNETVLASQITLPDYDVSGINAATYPYLKLKLNTSDSVNATPFQLKYWQLTFTESPEGAIAPNIYFTTKDTVEVGEPFTYGIAFKNISKVAFDSVKVKFAITDKNNIENIIPIPKQKDLAVNDTIKINVPIDTKSLSGHNTIFVNFNPDNDQPEQHLFNNYAFRNLYVRPDSLNPLLDVTFDGQHILNRDIISSKPTILVKLKDEAKWLVLDDTSLVNVQVKYPNGSLRRFYFTNNSDTLQFVPVGQAPNTDNTASVNFNPYFPEDGEYELIVTGKDKSENAAGKIEYRVAFQVINKPMISNMLNYPNPFTTSTAFVFTVTGSEVPQNIRIQILTVTGKVVREITKDELGPIRIGRNITEYKWDGTDQYGQKVGNGIYLYRVITNLNGKSLDKYKAEGDNTDKYFNKGYGKMYLMR